MTFVIVNATRVANGNTSAKVERDYPMGWIEDRVYTGQGLIDVAAETLRYGGPKGAPSTVEGAIEILEAIGYHVYKRETS